MALDDERRKVDDFLSGRGQVGFMAAAAILGVAFAVVLVMGLFS